MERSQLLRMNFELFIDRAAAILSNIHVHFWQLGDILCDFVHRAVLLVLFRFTIINANLMPFGTHVKLIIKACAFQVCTAF